MDNPFPLRRPEPPTAAYLADWVERMIESTQGDLLRSIGAMDYAKRIVDHDHPVKDIELPDKRAYDVVRLSASDYAVLLSWRQTRMVYDIDPTLMTSLAEMETRDVLPGEIFRHLPHPNPMFVFPGGFPLLMGDGSRGVLRAIFVNGRTAENAHCRTHDEEADQYQLTFITDLVNEAGDVVNLDQTRLSFPLAEGTTTIEKLVDEVLKDFTRNPLDGGSEPELRRTMQEMARLGVVHLLYTCSESADVEAEARPTRAIKKGKNAGKPTKEAKLIRQVGWHVGPAIKAAREHAEQEHTNSGSAGRTVRPHVRRAHLHTFAYGKGRKLRKVKWLPPNIINAKGEQVALDGTIIPVEK